ncbi:MAG: hypothetical protein CMH50_01200 [Myxococcales bacterium]|nr:hypothetical protein [Myxococcales bacterium]
MTTRRFLVVFGLIAGCATQPKAPEKTQIDERDRRPDLGSYLGEVDPNRTNEVDGETRYLLIGRLLMAGRTPTDVLGLARERGESELVRAALLARSGDESMALSIAKRQGEAGLAMAVGILAKQSRWDDALALIDEGTDSDLRKALRAWVAHEKGRDEEAISGLRSHLYAKGTDLDAYRVLIRIFMAQEKYRLARLACQGALRIDPEQADIHYLLGQVDAKLGRLAGARRAYEKALVFEPGHLGARTELARSGLANLDYRTALQHMTVAYRLAPGDEEVALLTALSLRANGACKEASKLLKLWTDRSRRALFNLGVLYLRCLDDPKQALQLLQRYVDQATPGADHQVHLLLQEAQLLSESE